MKIIKYLFVLIVIVSLTSCKSDDDNDAPYLLTNENFYGIYNLNYLVANFETTVIIEEIPFTVPSTSVGSVFQVETSFNLDETYTLVGQLLLTTIIKLNLRHIKKIEPKTELTIYNSPDSLNWILVIIPLEKVL